MLFRAGGQLRVAVIVKATFVIAPDRAMVRVDPEPLLRADRHADKDPLRSVIAASDRVPYRPRCDVVLVGQARAPLGAKVARLGLRLMVARGSELLLDKRLAAQGPRDASGEPQPFTTLPLSYERAAGGAENPVGVPAHGWPNLLDRWHRAEPVGFGPIGDRWPARRRLLRDAAVLDAAIPDFPPDFPWEFFSAAPPDQRVDFLRGDEWVGFEGMNAQIARVQSYLPSARGVARVYGAEPGLAAGRAVTLVGDTLAIDTDRLRVSAVWRGSFPVASEDALATLRLWAAVESAGEAAALPASYEEALRAPPPAPEPRAEGEASSTMVLPIADEERARSAPATPFPAQALPPRRASERPLPRATPFDKLAPLGARPSPTPIPPAPQPRDGDAVTTTEIPGDIAAALRVSAAPFDAGSTVALGTLAPPELRALLDAPALPFHGAAAPPPHASPPPPPPQDPGSTVAIGVMAPAELRGPALPFHGSAAPPPQPRSSPPPAPRMDGGATVAASPMSPELRAMLDAAALPFRREAAPPPLEAPVERLTVGQQAALGADRREAAPIAPAAPPPAEEAPEEEPTTLGAHFLAAMRRAGAVPATAG
jgi:hypothetical protein